MSSSFYAAMFSHISCIVKIYSMEYKQVDSQFKIDAGLEAKARWGWGSEAVRLAEIYAGDQYLKHVPVPRFRTPTITLDITIVINNIQDDGKAEYSNDQMLTFMQNKFRRLCSDRRVSCLQKY